MFPFDHELTQTWARVRVEHQRRGHDIGHGDAWIAATALRHRCALATNNRRDFEGTTGLMILPGPTVS